MNPKNTNKMSIIDEILDNSRECVLCYKGINVTKGPLIRPCRCYLVFVRLYGHKTGRLVQKMRPPVGRQ
jgi:hypothetical protein